MPLDLIHLQKSWGGCKARFTVDSDHEKASFPPIFHADKGLSHLRSMWETAHWICMWDGGNPLQKQTLAMNEYICFPDTDCPLQQEQPSIRCRGPATHATLRNTSESLHCCILLLLFFKALTSGPWIGLFHRSPSHTGVKWGENNQT